MENLDCETIINRYDSPTPVFYVDLPYPGNGVDYKHNMKPWEDHRKPATRLSKTQGKWIVSSYDCPEVRALYGSPHINAVQSASGMATADDGDSRVNNKEILVYYFEPSESQLLEAGAQGLFAVN